MSKIIFLPLSIIAGYYNIHPESHDGLIFLKYLTFKNFHSGIHAMSTDYKTQLDHVFYRGVCPTVNFYEL